MTAHDPEMWLERVLERAARNVVLPPEERWLPAPRAASPSSAWATVLVGLTLVLAIGLSARAIGEAVRPTSGVGTMSLEDVAWQRVTGDAPAWVPVLRPAWLPPRVLDADARCGPAARGAFSHPAGAVAEVRAGVAGYSVTYHPDAAANEDCPLVRVSMLVDVVDGNPAPGASAAPHSNEIVDREVTVLGSVGTLVRPREDPSELRLILGRGPFVYRVQAIGLSDEDFLRLIQSLQLVQR